ncbi:MAG: NADH-quinone oxidoreductase subunit E [Notoacmeibacter sp.]|nr:NADH-quinone oxidoreductase subunit E [Notoacmeibacter sp.]MCC0033076.1 NADH-quinone oxidoreductase subunit E [Brucellaceae bacterium]
MSVRRLAEDHLQPASFAFSKAMQVEVKKWQKKYPKGREQSAVIPLLMLAQEQEGWVSKAAIEHVSDMLAMPKIRVLEVATFYTQFQLQPVGTRAHIQVCGTTPCMLRGSEDLMAVCKSKIHHDQFHLNEAGTLSWEEVECQGACVNAPMVMIFKDAYEDLTPSRLEEIIDAFEAGKGNSVTPGPQNGRVFAAAATGATTLTDVEAIMKKSGKAAAKPAAKDEAKAAPSAAVEPKKAAGKAEASAKSAPATKASAAKAEAAAPAAAASFMDTSKAARPAKAAKSEKPAKGAKPEKAAKADEKPSLEDKNRPAGIAKPAQPDDLKMISGVGPKIEGILHSLGIYTFAQVASWKKAEREWVDGYLRFKGRIDREDWVAQAKALAKGGRDEYVRVFGKEPR